ncbi:DUF5798 family protein [Salinirubellus sp. GCM10025818]|uniref:DUF5798 family protein n=1 Tax=Salinirubellus TaxID=2162630 RepID=UPI0030CEEA06
MGFGSATKKISMVADMADEVYKRLNDLREQVHEMRQTVQSTDQRVERLERTVEGQTAVIEALAEQQGIDVEQVYAEAAIREAETTPEADDQGSPSTAEEGETPEAVDDSAATDEGPTSRTD